MKENQRNVALDLVLTLLLCGLWNIVVQYSQIKTLNILLKEERFSILKISLLSLVTCGLYFIYFEYKKTECYHELVTRKNPIHKDTTDVVLAVILTLTGISFVWDAILQSKINEYIEKNE